MDEEHKKHDGEHHQIKHEKSEMITINKLTIWKSVSAILGILLILAIFTGGFGVGKSSSIDANVIKEQPTQAAQPRQAAPSRAAQEPSPSVDMDSLIGDDAVKGDVNAPVTIIEWSDFECPFCTRFYTNTLGQIEKEYISTGKVRFIYKDFPLNFHANAQKAAEAAECAGEQEKYWEMHDKLFEEGVSGGVESFKQFASDIGLNTAEFNGCLDSGEMASEVQNDFSEGSAIGISGTPGFIINGKLVSGSQPFDVFKQIIDGELAK